MLLPHAYRLLRYLVGQLAVLVRSDLSKDAEFLVLCQVTGLFDFDGGTGRGAVGARSAVVPARRILGLLIVATSAGNVTYDLSGSSCRVAAYRLFLVCDMARGGRPTLLSNERNSLLCQTGPGTQMGELLRRYWHPIAGAAEFGQRTVKPVRILAEDLTLYRDKSGNYGLVDRHCPHRRADMTYGFVEECGLRCNYHGWLFDHTGKCLHQPFEETRHPEGNFKNKVRIKAYEVREKAGLLWAYLGPQPAPELPDWERFYARGYKQIAISEVPCNWFQCQENSIDPVHFEWLHDNWSKVLRGEDGPRAPAHRRLGFDEFDYGFIYRRIRDDTTEKNELWTTGRVCLWPNCLYTGHFEWRVPIDDENTLSVGWFIDELPGDMPFEQDVIPCWQAPVRDAETGQWISSHVMNQDFIAWVGQGVIADRSKEHLGESDRGVILIRKRLMDDIQVVAAGNDPMATIRDPGVNHRVHLPTIGGPDRLAAKSGPPRFPFLAGQPAAVREEFERVWLDCAAASVRLSAGD